MWIFLYVLAAMGVGYWAKLDRRMPALWFALAILLTPLGGSLALMAAQRWFPNHL